MFLFLQILKASLMTTSGCFAVTLAIQALKLNPTPTHEGAVGFLMAFLPTGLAAWWMFRKLQARYTRREAKRIAIAVALFTPISLGVAAVLAEFTGGLAAGLWNPLGLVGAFAGVVLFTAVLNYGLCKLVSWRAANTGGLTASVTPLLFVYGTLRSEVLNEWSRFLAARAEQLGSAKVRGVLFDLGSYPGMVASADAPSFVIGEVFKLNDPSGAFSELDRYEGDDFERQTVSAKLDDGRNIEAWAYLYGRDTSDKPRIASGDFLQSLNR